MLRQSRGLTLASLAGALLIPTLAAAQAPPHHKPHIVPNKEQSGPKDCVHTRTTTGQGKGTDVQAPEGHALSQQLAQANGVICPPPQVDPGMTKKPASNSGGTMPVIPPPGTGKNPSNVEPK